MKHILLTSALALTFSTLAACSSPTTQDTKPDSKAAEIVAPVTLDTVINDTRRITDQPRDQFRNPKATLEFFEVGPDKHVAEIWPGWYTPIIAPYLAANNGTYTAVLYPETERTADRLAAFKESVADTEVFGTVQYGVLSADTPEIMPAQSADIILTFRNVHNWMGRGYAETSFAQFYDALKPGGILGVVEHRLPESAVQDPMGASGYVQESYVKALAKEAGFEFVEASEINANPNDTADHPLGVWTLPPRSRVPEPGSEAAKDFNPELYKNIGESDRMTLKFRKPLAAE